MSSLRLLRRRDPGRDLAGHPLPLLPGHHPVRRSATRRSASTCGATSAARWRSRRPAASGCCSRRPHGRLPARDERRRRYLGGRVPGGHGRVGDGPARLSHPGGPLVLLGSREHPARTSPTPRAGASRRGAPAAGSPATPAISGGPVSGGIVPVAVVPMEEDVRGVVAHEAIPSWPGGGAGCAGRRVPDLRRVCAGPPAGERLRHPRHHLVPGLQGQWLLRLHRLRYLVDGRLAPTYAGSPIVAYFSVSSGGYAGGGAAYLPAQPDPGKGCRPTRTGRGPRPSPPPPSRARGRRSAGSPSYGSWPATVRATWGGRVTSMAFDGTSGSVTVSGDTVRGRFGLRSTYFTPPQSSTTPGFPRDYTGDGRAEPDVYQSGRQPRSAVASDGPATGCVRLVPAVGECGSVAAVSSPGTWDADRIADVMTVDASGRACSAARRWGRTAARWARGCSGTTSSSRWRLQRRRAVWTSSRGAALTPRCGCLGRGGRHAHRPDPGGAVDGPGADFLQSGDSDGDGGSTW